MKYIVTITARVTKKIEIEDAVDEQDATDQAHSVFTAAHDGTVEKYYEDVDHVEKIEE